MSHLTQALIIDLTESPRTCTPVAALSVDTFMLASMTTCCALIDIPTRNAVRSESIAGRTSTDETTVRIFTPLLTNFGDQGTFIDVYNFQSSHNYHQD